jgi:hypothetical protein
VRRVATRPLNPAATAAANAAISGAYPVPPAPGDAAYPAFQKAWMDAYVANGGGYTAQTPADARKEVQAVEAAAPKAKDSCSIVQSCPRQQAGGSAGSTQTGFTPPPTPCTCKLTTLTVKCSHGRSASNGLLQIVADETAKGDPLTIGHGSTGGCSAKLVTRLRGLSGPRETIGPRDVVAGLAGPRVVQAGYLGGWGATPSRGSIEATACGGNPQTVRIERFPAGESKLQFNLTKILEAFTSNFRRLPFDLRLFTTKGTPRKMRRPGEAKAEDFTLEGLKKRARKNYSNEVKGEIVWQIASAWKEEAGSNLVYCECATALAADPLWEAGTTILLYGINVPDKIAEIFDITAGLFLVINGKLTVSIQAAVRKYPLPRDEFTWDSLQGRGGGEVELGFEAKFCVWSASVVQASGKATARASASSSLRQSGRKVMLDTALNVGMLQANVKAEFWWGLIEYERNWLIWDGYNDKSATEVVDFS